MDSIAKLDNAALPNAIPLSIKEIPHDLQILDVPLDTDLAHH
jgi:hypothetical protein